MAYADKVREGEGDGRGGEDPYSIVNSGTAEEDL